LGVAGFFPAPPPIWRFWIMRARGCGTHRGTLENVASPIVRLFVFPRYS
jgi:hypothetical protein